jgi:hypothetical protein
VELGFELQTLCSQSRHCTTRVNLTPEQPFLIHLLSIPWCVCVGPGHWSYFAEESAKIILSQGHQLPRCWAQHANLHLWTPSPVFLLPHQTEAASKLNEPPKWNNVTSVLPGTLLKCFRIISASGTSLRGRKLVHHSNQVCHRGCVMMFENIIQWTSELTRLRHL